MIQIGYTALFIVPNLEMAQLLLDRGADINIRDHVSLHGWYNQSMRWSGLAANCCQLIDCISTFASSAIIAMKSPLSFVWLRS